MSETKESNKKLLRTIIIACSVVCLVLLSIPVIFVTYITTKCNMRMDDLNHQAQSIQSKLNTITENRPWIKASVNQQGDCITGSGASFTIAIKKEHQDFEDAELEINKLLEEQQLPAPSDKGAAYLTNSDNTSDRTSRNTIVHNRTLNNKFQTIYQYVHTLQSPVSCENMDTAVCASATKSGYDSNFTLDNTVIVTTLSGFIEYDVYNGE